MSLPISAMMHTPVTTLAMDDPLPEIEAVFEREGLAWAPVVEGDGRVVGVLGRADLQRARGRDADPAHLRAWQLCSYKPLVVAPDTPAREVAQQMVQRHVHHVVVMGADGLAGVVSSLDFVRCFAEGA